MPNLQFSPAPSHGNAADREKENGRLVSSSSSSLSSPVGVGKGNGADISPRLRSPGIGSHGGRAPLERISSESTGDTSGASALGIDHSRMVGARPRADSPGGESEYGEGEIAEPAVRATVTHSPYPRGGAVTAGYSSGDAYDGTEMAVGAGAASPVSSPAQGTVPAALGAAAAGAYGGGVPGEGGFEETGVADNGLNGAHGDGAGGVLDDLGCDRLDGGAAASDCAVRSPGMAADIGEFHVRVVRSSLVMSCIEAFWAFLLLCWSCMSLDMFRYFQVMSFLERVGVVALFMVALFLLLILSRTDRLLHSFVQASLLPGNISEHKCLENTSTYVLHHNRSLSDQELLGAVPTTPL